MHKSTEFRPASEFLKGMRRDNRYIPFTEPDTWSFNVKMVNNPGDYICSPGGSNPGCVLAPEKE